MNDSYKRFYETLHTPTLEDEIRTLQLKLESAVHVRSNRSDSPSTSWRCDVCNFEDDDSEVVYRHVKTAHLYPDEDASLSTIPFFK